MLTLNGVAGSYVDALAKVTAQAQAYYGVRPFQILVIRSVGDVGPDPEYKFEAVVQGKDNNGTE